MPQTLFITGAAGYVGEMLCDQLSRRDDVSAIIALDKLPQTEFLKSVPKLTYIEHNLADEGWEEVVAAHGPTVIIHTAWQIRSLYGQAGTQWRWNVEASERVFQFAFTTSSVRKLIHFGTAASYSARPENTFEHRFTELEGLRDDSYLYAREKKAAEDRLHSLFQTTRNQGESTPQIFVVRPAAITGPRGRFLRVRFGLQSALQGNFEKKGLAKLIAALTAVMPATKGWVRQFVHEDDVVDVVSLFAFEPFSQPYQAFNLTPESPLVYPSEMGAAVGKRVVMLSPFLVRIVFWFFWHASRGRVPTSPGSWRFYSYPIVMSGKKLQMVYDCKYDALDAVTYTDGRYEAELPPELRHSKPAA